MVFAFFAVMCGMLAMSWPLPNTPPAPSAPMPQANTGSQRARPRQRARQWWALGGLGLRLAIALGACVLLVQGLWPAFRASAACRHGLELMLVDPDAAIPEFHRAVALAPWNDVYWLQLGIAHYSCAGAAAELDKLKHLHGSHAALRRAIALEPGRGPHRLWLARVLGEQVHRGLASPAHVLAQLDMALALEKSNAYFHADACTLALSLHELERARVYAAAGTRLYPDFAPARAQLGHIALLQHRYAEAIEHLQRSLTLNWRDRPDERCLAQTSLAEAKRQVDKAQPGAR
jgi:tetratricopeptide (TPR) repeat protein